MNTTAEFIKGVLSGDRRSVSRAITALENGDQDAYEVRSAIGPHLGRAHVLGVTGPPGGGKSTLVAALIQSFRRLGRSVAVVAIDPSSPFSGGAVLGDRIRMGKSQADDGVFIRSLASRGHLGGLARSAGDVIDVFDAAGFDIVIVETVGAGQSEVEITEFADTRVVVCPPGLGDDVQAIKAGVLEIADVFVVTKADLPGARKTERELASMLGIRRGGMPVPPVMKVISTSGEGIDDLVAWFEQRTQRGRRRAPGGAKAAFNLLSKCITADRYASSLGLELVEAAIGSATVRMKVAARHINFNGRCHGGAIFSLGDTALGLACNSQGKLAVLVDGNLSITAAVEEGEWLVACAREVSRSRRIGSYQVDISRGRDGAHVALLHGTVYVLDKEVAVAEAAS